MNNSAILKSVKKTLRKQTNLDSIIQDTVKGYIELNERIIGNCRSPDSDPEVRNSDTTEYEKKIAHLKKSLGINGWGIGHTLNIDYLHYAAQKYHGESFLPHDEIMYLGNIAESLPKRTALIDPELDRVNNERHDPQHRKSGERIQIIREILLQALQEEKVFDGDALAFSRYGGNVAYATNMLRSAYEVHETSPGKFLSKTDAQSYVQEDITALENAIAKHQITKKMSSGWVEKVESEPQQKSTAQGMEWL